MKADPKSVLTGSHFIDGDHAAAEGALAAGCRFFGGYPITPSTEVAERFARRCPQVDAIFIQMEDELGSLASVIGAVWAGKKAMTVTSGPGFSLMMEHIGLAAMLETPCVLVNVQRGGPSTGLPTLTGQADMMQARWGSHGDYEIIAVSPNSPQETFEFTIKAFNLSEQYRVPVFVMMDECVGHMTEKVVIPPADEIELVERKWYKGPPEEYLPFKPDKDMVPFMTKIGDGTRFHVTGLTHDYKGYPVMNAACQEQNVRRLVDKIRLNTDKICEWEEDSIEDAEVVVLSYGITSRVAIRAIDLAREKGIKVGAMRLVVVWPFPEERVRELSKKVKTFVVPEINYGQIVLEVDRCCQGRARAVLAPHGGGWVHDPEDILYAIEQAVKDDSPIEGYKEYRRKK
ncbi:2-oxoacid:acceptor oxidoreductase subunit alpha [candidate division TA06 bacterium]|uniref:2-oxoacid:acceptor oxidoreductase subunit alpha n=1 Tax=candidate division TA06 bacterium TaxID=2250710 RepID=A0A523UQA5_UNCT6|nr:MAG: 2-oxoacid:acceptor oxidoreductase subunit alpha [candidate division TA06 bacterium]